MSSAWVKNQIWSPDNSASEAKFIPFGQDVSQDFAQQNEAFSVGSRYLERLLEDQEVEQYLNHQIEQRLRIKLLSVLNEFESPNNASSQNLSDLSVSQMEALIKTRRTSLLESSKQLINELQQRKETCDKVWSEMMQQFLAERDRNLKIHEEQWVKAIGYIIEKLQFKNSEMRIEQIASWVNANISRFKERQNIVVYLSPEDAEQIDSSPEESAPQKWKICKDDSLSPGKVRIEAEHVGIIFDPEKNLRTLWKALEIE